MELDKLNEEQEGDEMKRVVVCPKCGQPEYYGMMIWLNLYGSTTTKTACRKCTYEIWGKQNPKWRRERADFSFPQYEDGKIYTSFIQGSAHNGRE